MIIISFGPNNSSGLSPNQNGYIACQSEARHAYQSYVPHYPLSFGQGDTLISQSFNIGRIKFILTDLRSEKRRPLFNGDCEMSDATDCEKIMPGSNFGYPDHLQWFKNELLDAKSNNLAVVWHSSFPFISTPDLSWFNCGDEICINWKVKNYEGKLVYNETGEILQHSFCLQVNN